MRNVGPRATSTSMSAVDDDDGDDENQTADNDH